ncbi:hypothetical protein HDU92_002249 [Lobulomyces angularis]|nr:hypothetical protein HDU92_002249 [Lobulomyces angularis]
MYKRKSINYHILPLERRKAAREKFRLKKNEPENSLSTFNAIDRDKLLYAITNNSNWDFKLRELLLIEAKSDTTQYSLEDINNYFDKNHKDEKEFSKESNFVEDQFVLSEDNELESDEVDFPENEEILSEFTASQLESKKALKRRSSQLASIIGFGFTSMRLRDIVIEANNKKPIVSEKLTSDLLDVSAEPNSPNSPNAKPKQRLTLRKRQISISNLNNKFSTSSDTIVEEDEEEEEVDDSSKNNSSAEDVDFSEEKKKKKNVYTTKSLNFKNSINKINPSFVNNLNTLTTEEKKKSLKKLTKSAANLKSTGNWLKVRRSQVVLNAFKKYPLNNNQLSEKIVTPTDISLAKDEYNNLEKKNLDLQSVLEELDENLKVKGSSSIIENYSQQNINIAEII